MTLRILLIFLVGLLAAGCSQKSVIDTLSTEDERKLILNFVEELRTGQVQKITQQMPAERPADINAAVQQTAPMLQKSGANYTIQSVSQIWDAAAGKYKIFMLEGGSGNHWAVIRIDLISDDQQPKIKGFHVTPMAESVTASMAFDRGKVGWRGYLWIAAMLVNFALCVTALRVVWRRKWIKRRWLWMVASLVGLTAFQLNWATGEWAFLPLQFLLFGASALKVGVFAPWIFSFSIPLLPVVILWKFARQDIQPKPSPEELLL